MTNPAGLATDDAVAFADFHEEYLSSNIQLADAKAGVALVLTSGVLAFLLQNAAFRADLSGAFSLPTALAFGAALAMGGAAAMSYGVVMPRLSSSGQGFVFWGDVAGRADAAAFRRQFFDLTPEALAAARLDHCFELSGVCRNKFQRLNLAMKVAAVGFVATAVWLFQHAPATPAA